jgi:signal transduction histidine kinase
MAAAERDLASPVERPLRVLLVEDNEAHAQLATAWIEHEGGGRFSVTCADRLAAALTQLSANPYDLVLLDLSLPDSDGLETFHALRARAGAIPIVLMTGHGDERLALQAMHEGAQDYLVKGDTDGRLLVRALHYAVQRRRAEVAERRLLEAQRLESLSLLAGGIAHQLNNLLVVIIGNVSLAASAFPADDTVAHYLNEVETASQQAARLARQMLAYSGRGGFVVRTIDLNEAVRSACDALAARFDTGAGLDLKLARIPVLIEADEAQIAQLVMNLVTNALEAVEGTSGGVHVRTALARALEADFRRSYMSPSLPPGLYAELVVSDTGAGMTAEAQSHVFEPFFSTKLAGRGLGLPATLGIVRGHAGAIAVDSAPGKGTSVRVLLPAAPVGTEIARS